MTDAKSSGYTPTRQEVAKRDVAVQAERHWWITKLEELAADWCEERDYNMQELNEPLIASVLDSVAKEIDALIAERERP